MRNFSVYLCLLLFSSSVLAFTEGSCNNCTEQQRRGVAQTVAPYTSYEWHRVYIHDLESMTFHAYDVRHEIEPGSAVTRVRNVTIPTDIKEQWDAVARINTVVIVGTGGIVDIPASEYPTAYDMVNNNIGMHWAYQNWVEENDLRFVGGFLSPGQVFTLTNLAAALTTKVSNMNIYSRLQFADGSSIKLNVVTIDLGTGEIEVEFGSGKDADGNPIYQDITDLSGSTIAFGSVGNALAFANYIDRNGGTIDLALGGGGGGGYTFSCDKTPTGIKCRKLH